MAKSKKKSPVSIKDTKNDGIEIDLDKLLIPGSILIAGLMLSISVFLGIRGISDTVIGSPKGTPTVAPTQNPIDGEGSTTIGDSPVLGDKTKAKIAIVEFSDYECPVSQYYYNQLYKQLTQQYVDNGQAIYVYKNLIAVPSHNPNATLEARAAICVQKLAGDAKYFTYHDYLFGATQANGIGITGGQDTLVNQASTLGIDKNAFTTCLNDAGTVSRMTTDENTATSADLNATPSFLIGKLSADGKVTGYKVIGAKSLTSFQYVIEQALAN